MHSKCCALLCLSCQVIWPKAGGSLLQHDAFSCERWGGGVGWPSVRVGGEHVGSVMLDGKERQVDVDILLAAAPPAQCQRNLSEERLAELRAIVEADGLHGFLAGKANSTAPSPAPTAVTAPNATAHTSAPSLALPPRHG